VITQKILQDDGPIPSPRTAGKVVELTAAEIIKRYQEQSLYPACGYKQVLGKNKVNHNRNRLYGKVTLYGFAAGEEKAMQDHFGKGLRRKNMGNSQSS
jgi:hypothetical protein